jgi:YD repeat-containing protein
MYSSAFTQQTGPISQVLEAARAPEGQDWALVWTEEDLLSERVMTERSGWFSSVERQVFALDPFASRGAETGTTRMERSIVLPQRPYQALEELDPPGFGTVRKFVVSPAGRVLRY